MHEDIPFNTPGLWVKHRFWANWYKVTEADALSIWLETDTGFEVGPCSTAAIYEKKVVK